MDYNKTVLKRWSRTILSICSTLLNVPLKLKGRSRIRLGFGFFFVFLPLYFSAAVRRHRRKTAGLPVLSSGRCFPPGGASCCFHGPFPGRVIYLFCFSPRQLRQTFGAFCFSLFFLRRFCPVAKSGIRKLRQSAGFSKGKSGLFFVFILLILFRILPKNPARITQEVK